MGMASSCWTNYLQTEKTRGNRKETDEHRSSDQIERETHRQRCRRRGRERGRRKQRHKQRNRHRQRRIYRHRHRHRHTHRHDIETQYRNMTRREDADNVSKISMKVCVCLCFPRACCKWVHGSNATDFVVAVPTGKGFTSYLEGLASASRTEPQQNAAYAPKETLYALVVNSKLPSFRGLFILVGEVSS